MSCGLKCYYQESVVMVVLGSDERINCLSCIVCQWVTNEARFAAFHNITTESLACFIFLFLLDRFHHICGIDQWTEALLYIAFRHGEKRKRDDGIGGARWNYAIEERFVELWQYSCFYCVPLRDYMKWKKINASEW